MWGFPWAAHWVDGKADWWAAPRDYQSERYLAVYSVRYWVGNSAVSWAKTMAEM